MGLAAAQPPLLLAPLFSISLGSSQEHWESFILDPEDKTMRWQLGALRFVPHRPGEQGHRGTGVPPPQSLTANGVGQAPDTATGDPSGSRTATGALVLPVDSPTGPPCTPHAGVPRGPHPCPHQATASLLARVPVRQQAGCGRRGAKPSFHILPVSFLCHTSFFFFSFPLSSLPLPKRGGLAQRALNTFAFPRQA